MSVKSNPVGVLPGLISAYISRLDLGSLSDELSFDRTFRDPLIELYKK